MTDVQIRIDKLRLKLADTHNEFVNFGNGWCVQIKRYSGNTGWYMFCANTGGSGTQDYEAVHYTVDAVLQEMYLLSIK